MTIRGLANQMIMALVVMVAALAAYAALSPASASFAQNPALDLKSFQDRAISGSNEIKAADRKVQSAYRKYTTAVDKANGTYVGSSTDSSIDDALTKYFAPLQSYNDYLAAKMERLSSSRTVLVDSLSTYYSLMDCDFRIKRQNRDIATFEKEVRKKELLRAKGLATRLDVETLQSQLDDMRYELRSLVRERAKYQARANQKIGEPLRSKFDTVQIDISYVKTFDTAAITELAMKYSKSVVTAKYDSEEAQYRYDLHMAYEDDDTADLVEKHQSQYDSAVDSRSAYDMARLAEEISIDSYYDDAMNASDDVDIVDMKFRIEKLRYEKNAYLFKKGRLDSISMQKSLDSYEKAMDDLSLAQFSRYRAIKAFEYYIDTLVDVR